MHRRKFIQSSSFILGGLSSGFTFNTARDDEMKITTVRGPISPGSMGITLPHEHVLVDFIGADQVSPERYNKEKAFNVILPYLKALREKGCKTLVECTPAYLGRDVALLKRLSKASGLHILTNTGYYSAVKGKYLPDHVASESAAQLAGRWIGEYVEGIDKTDVKPGFIKISVDAGSLPEVSRKIVRAAALTHVKTGLTIASHTGNGQAALEELAILQEEGVDGSVFIWVHAQNEKNNMIHLQAANFGAWIEFDGINPESMSGHIEMVKNMKSHGKLNQVLISQDAGWYHVGEPGGGKFRNYETLFTNFIPALKDNGFTEEEVRQLIEDNPREAYTVRIRGN